MKKLVRLKKWLTISEAARHLSILFGEDVSEADVLRLALDREIKLSVYLVNGALVRCGRLEPTLLAAKDFGFEETEAAWVRIFEAITHDDLRKIRFRGHVTNIGGVWDLPMLGLEQFDVERRLQELTNGPKVNVPSQFRRYGPIVFSEQGMYCELLLKTSEFTEQIKLRESERTGPLGSMPTEPDYDPILYDTADRLPEDSVLVVRTSALEELEARRTEPERRIDKPIELRERRTLLVIIAALVKMAGFDRAGPSKAAAAIESETALMGARVSARAIADHLNKISDALESRKEN